MIKRALGPSGAGWPSNGVAAVFFSALAALALGAFIYFLVRSVQLRDPLRGSLAIIAAGFTVALAYQVLALLVPGHPTISQITHHAFETHPRVWDAIYLAIMLGAGALVVHFTRQAADGESNLPVVVGGIIALALGMVISYKSNWLP